VIRPVELHDFLLSFFASASIIVSGACYALLFAWARLAGRRAVLAWAYAAYALLAVSVWLLAEAAHFEGYWRVLSGAMLAGYFVAPRAVFRLCSATHAAEHDEQTRSAISRPSQENPP
jgi:membrane associated rhomboid family serine protease